MRKVKYGNLISSYAKALFLISEDKLDVIREEVEFLLVFFKDQHDIFVYLSNPMIPIAHKKEIIFYMKKYLNENLVKFIVVICINKRFNLLSSMLKEFLNFIRKDKNEFEITIESAKPLKESEIKIITESLNFLGKIIKVSNVVDPSILGGFTVRYDFTLIDASLKSYLERLVDLSKIEVLRYSE